MDWDKVRIFHAAAEAGSFTHAGDSLNMSQSAVSRQVSTLERELSVPLFHRHARGLMLTEQGEMLYRTAHEVFAKLQVAEILLTDTTTKPSGDLRVTAPVGLGSVWLTPRLNEFLELYPDIRLQLILSDSQVDIAMGAADVAIWAEEPQQPELIRRPLFTMHLHAYATSKYIREFDTPKSLADLDSHRLVSFTGNTPSHLTAVNWLETAGKLNGEARQPVLRVNNLMALKYAVAAGLGIGMIPDYMTDAEPDFLPVLRDESLPAIMTYFVYPEELRSSKRVQVFRDFLVAKARQWKF